MGSTSRYHIHMGVHLFTLYSTVNIEEDHQAQVDLHASLDCVGLRQQLPRALGALAPAKLKLLTSK